MKKIIALTLVLVFALAILAGCSKGGTDSTKSTQETKASTAVSTTAQPTTAATETETETQNIINSGTFDLGGEIQVTLTGSWYAMDYKDGDSNVKMYNDSLDDTQFGYVNVQLQTAIKGSDGREGAEYWADAINDNYGGDKDIDKYTTDGGVEYIWLKAEKDQNILFQDIDDEHYIQVSCMFLDFDGCRDILEFIEF